MHNVRSHSSAPSASAELLRRWIDPDVLSLSLYTYLKR
jgi:hypothetical protein